MLRVILKIVAIILGITYLFLVLPANAESPVGIKIQPEWERVRDPLFEKIAECESNHNLLAKNPYSSASGAYQFIKKSWLYYGKKYWGDNLETKDIFSEDNIELAWWIYTTKGTKDWESDPKSYNCWKGEIPNATHKGIYKNPL